jgi:phosphoribosylamine--glycine ligase/phosphoribosylaminoimidazole synthetase
VSRRVLVVGSGGREHALAWAALKSPLVETVFTAPGNAATPHPVAIAADDVSALVNLCQRESIDLVLVGPEAALAAGLVDALRDVGVAAFGPTRAAAELEWSKTFTRRFCERHAIASPAFAAFTTAQPAIAWIDAFGRPVVIKAAGLAAGKGVIVPEGRADTVDAVRTLVASGEIVVEERLDGEEVSLMAFSDGHMVIAMPPAQDHKRIGEGDTGPNTGGMGAYAPTPACPPELVKQLVVDILQPTVDAMRSEGRPYVGVLYAGLMLTSSGPKVLEFNCRFGDPEAQAILPLLHTDLIEVVDACLRGRVDQIDIVWRDEVACAVVAAAPGYPDAPMVGAPVRGLAGVECEGTLLFHGATRTQGSDVVTSGGRVLSCVGLGADLAAARARAYSALSTIDFPGKQVRRDIGWRALARTTGGYVGAGVDIDAGNRAVTLMSAAVKATHGPAVLRGIGAFGGVFDLTAVSSYREPVLVASTDGVGTKVMVATEAGRAGGVGADIVNHCINDVLVQRARPLFFLDYIASARLEPEHVAAIVTSMARACSAAGCALLGGETAEMPGVYHDGHFDIAGTLVGVAEKQRLLPRDDIGAGDVLIGIASNGAHTNGYSLLRRVFAGLPLDAQPAPLDRSLGDTLLEPHRSYLPVLATLLDTELVKALVHITGGGLPENLPRVLPPGCGAVVRLGSWPVPPLFRLVTSVSALSPEELHRTLNMGIGMVVVCASEDVDRAQDLIDEPTWVIGEITDKSGVVLA